jgi:hypothetical protein
VCPRSGSEEFSRLARAASVTVIAGAARGARASFDAPARRARLGAMSWKRPCKRMAKHPEIVADLRFPRPALEVRGESSPRLDEDGVTVPFLLDSVGTHDPPAVRASRAASAGKVWRDGTRCRDGKTGWRRQASPRGAGVGSR